MSENNIIDFGRVIGDRGIYLYIQDIIVLPEFQGHGIGKHIMCAVMNYF
ncbi:GNAT family N-acetyltransferase, partial [Methanosarcina horonobensis]